MGGIRDDEKSDERLSAQRFDSMASNTSNTSNTIVGSEAGTTTEKKTKTSDRNPFPERPWRKKATSWDAIRSHPYAGSGTESDPYVVTWLEGDAENPHNYKFGYKWAITMMCELQTRRS